MNDIKKRIAWVAVFALLLQAAALRLPALAAGSDVVINEVAWAGSDNSANDEWIELFNNSAVAVDLSGWSIEDDGASVGIIESGEIAPYGYFLIEDSEDAVPGVNADAILGLSLANSGDSLILKDAGGSVIDGVNTSGAEWPAGDSTTKATMERVDPEVGGDVVSNWADSAGTPGRANVNYTGGVAVSMALSDDTPENGDTLTVAVNVGTVTDLFAYGFEINYDDSVLDFVSATESDFLKSDGESTSFNYGLENGLEGSLILGNARLSYPASGVDGSGELFSLEFEVLADEAESEIIFGGENFLADSNFDMPSNYTAASFVVGDSGGGGAEVDPVENLVIAEGSERYSLALNWDAPTTGADSYRVYRAKTNASYELIGEVSTTEFVDTNDLVVYVNYDYKVTAVLDSAESTAVEIPGAETRGLIGDNNRDDRVDGRDLENLARNYTLGVADTDFDALIDSNFDGIIDGSDLIDIGANFALTY